MIGLLAVLIALIAVFTLLIRIPTPARGYVNLSDVAITFAGLAFGPWVGAIAGGIGTALADLLGGFAPYAPISFVAHGLQGFLVGLGILIFFVLIIRHAARGTFIASLVIPPVVWLIFSTATILWVAIATSLVVAIRFTIDWNRKYRELWLDREPQENGNS
mgnify:CR=1 FL=1